MADFRVFFRCGRTNLDCDILESFLTEAGGGKRSSGAKENPFSCRVLSGMRPTTQRRVRRVTRLKITVARDSRSRVFAAVPQLVCVSGRWTPPANRKGSQFWRRQN